MSENTLYNKLKENREKKGLTQEELAKVVGVSRQTIITIEKHFCDPSTSLALSISEALDLQVEEIFKLKRIQNG